MALPRPCRRCGRPGTTTGLCPSCTSVANAVREQGRGTAAQRGYDAEHRRRAAALRREGRRCCLCGTPIDYALRAPDPRSFTAHHLTRDKRGPLDAAHRDCNERAGAPQ